MLGKKRLRDQESLSEEDQRKLLALSEQLDKYDFSKGSLKASLLEELKKGLLKCSSEEVTSSRSTSTLNTFTQQKQQLQKDCLEVFTKLGNLSKTIEELTVPTSLQQSVKSPKIPKIGNESSETVPESVFKDIESLSLLSQVSPVSRSLYDDGQFSTEGDIRSRQKKNAVHSALLNKPIILTSANSILGRQSTCALSSPMSSSIENYLPLDGKQVISFLLSLEVEHFRALDLETAMKDALKNFKIKEDNFLESGKDIESFNASINPISKALESFSTQVDFQQAEEVGAIFDSCLVRLRAPSLLIGRSECESEPEVEEIVDCLVGLTALLNAHSRLRPPASATLASRFQNVDEVVISIARQFTLLSNSLLTPLPLVVSQKKKFLTKEYLAIFEKTQKDSQVLEKMETQFPTAYQENLVLAALMTLKRIFSIDYISGLGAKVGVKALDSLIDAFLPFWLLKLSSGCQRYSNLYKPIEDFGASHLFWGHVSSSFEAKTLLFVVPEIASPGKTINVIALLTVLLKLVNKLTSNGQRVIAKIKGKEDAEVLAKKLLTNLLLQIYKILKKLKKMEKELKVDDQESSNLEELLYQLHLFLESHDGPHKSAHTFGEIVFNLSFLCAKSLLSILAINLGDTIWKFFGKVEAAIETDKKCGLTIIKYLQFNYLYHPTLKPLFEIESGDLGATTSSSPPKLPEVDCGDNSKNKKVTCVAEVSNADNFGDTKCSTTTLSRASLVEEALSTFCKSLTDLSNQMLSTTSSFESHLNSLTKNSQEVNKSAEESTLAEKSENVAAANVCLVDGSKAIPPFQLFFSAFLQASSAISKVSVVAKAVAVAQKEVNLQELSSCSGELLKEMQELQKQMTAYAQTIAQLFKKIEY